MNPKLEHNCNLCKYNWRSTKNRPTACPRCKRYNWDDPIPSEIEGQPFWRANIHHMIPVKILEASAKYGGSFIIQAIGGTGAQKVKFDEIEFVKPD
jgi:hypothetical protein